MKTPTELFRDEVTGALVAQRQLMARLDAASGAARSSEDVMLAKQVERLAEFARLLGIRLATIERQIAEVVQ